MSSNRFIFPLIKAHFDGNHQEFVRISDQISNDFEFSGKKILAKDIRDLISADNGDITIAKEISLPDTISEFVKVYHSDVLVSDIQSSKSVLQGVNRIVHSLEHAGRLKKFNIPIERKVLLSGHSGTGKTMTAYAIANAIRKPIFVVNTSSVFDKYLGGTSQRLNRIFAEMHNYPGVWFFDEFDGIAQSRDDGIDSGEVRRVVNAMLQLIDQDNSNTILIAATNFGGGLDQAILRRFHTGIFYDLPDKVACVSIVRKCFAMFPDFDFDEDRVFNACSTLSHGDIREACMSAARNAILYHDERIDEEIIERSLVDRARVKGHS